MHKMIDYMNRLTAILFAQTIELVLLRRKVAEQSRQLDEIRRVFGHVRVYTVAD